MDFSLVSPSGEVVALLSAASAEELEASVLDGHVLLEGLPPSPGAYLVGGNWVQRPQQPSREHAWNTQLKCWHDPRSIEALRADKWAQIKQARTAAETALINVAGRTYDADVESQRRISGAVQLAVLAPAGWTIDWTLADNTVATLTAAEVVAVGIALGAQVSAAHAAARLLREQIDAASSINDLQSITWPSA